ncbi:helix-turn-helix domain-containing protein [uncultured Sphaerochaeta sp.]|uniref:AraC family transcriptional regulator n=1 Tax=uncultured Sphaerochaeta sp. TaxID=886478 RepID=UPI002A0A80A3|nr:helix-turn-helix domain-containing protein [uncultured Sphaerochaeta sp.]
MNGFENIIQAVEIYERSLIDHKKIPSVSALAQRTGYSPYHFTRLFSSVVGIGPKEYMQGRLLTHMLDELRATSKTLALLSEQYGYVDYASFSRAFKNRFGYSPREARDQQLSIFQGRVEIFKPDSRKEIIPCLPQPQIMSLQPFVLSGIAFFIGNETKSFHSQWNTFMQAEDQIEGVKEPRKFHQYSSWLEEGELPGLSVLCALEVVENTIQKNVFTTRIVEGGDYLQFLHEGDISQISQTYRYIYGTWFASQEIQPRGCWEFQRYSQDGNTVEIFIPVKTGILLPN